MQRPLAPALSMWLDLANERLWCGERAVTLRPKTFALLRHLVAHPGQLRTKAALLEALWPELVVSEVVLSVCIRELRQALGDDAKAPRFIETVHRRGYRFIGDLPTAPPSSPAAPALPPALPGREAALEALQRALATALTGVRQLLFVTGEAGLGKTTLVEAFLTSAAHQGPLWIGRGQCLDHYGAGEAYLPLLEAMERLCRGPGGADIVEILRRQAPSWLVQMPGVVPPAACEDLQHRVPGTTQARMLRELAEALTVVTAVQPLVLVLEDLHWSDHATLDMLATLARRREPARLLVLGTYRPPDALHRGHPLATVHAELHLHGQCVDLPLTLLPAAAVAAYLAGRFPEAQLPGALVRLVHQRTEGNPLFMVQLVEDWVRRGWLAQVDGRWILQVGRTTLARSMPAGVQQMLEHQFDRLRPRDQRVLMGGSVAGATFSAAAVAAGLEAAVVTVEEWCASLARRQQWLEACGTQVWPDGTVAGVYRFTHALYQEVAYARLTAAQRVQLHHRIGAREEVGYGAQSPARAAVLAVHFARGGDPDRAIQYRQHAAETALGRCAYTEAIVHLTHALALLVTRPETPARAQQELALQMALGPAVMNTHGQAATAAAHAYGRARELCQQVGATPQLIPVLRGLCLFYHNRGALAEARALGAQLLTLAEQTGDPGNLIQAHQAVGQTAYSLGALPVARAHLEYGLTLYHPHQHHTQAWLYGFDPAVFCDAYTAWTLWLLGYPAQAQAHLATALARAQALAHPFSLACALAHASRLHAYQRDLVAVHAWADALIALSQEQGFAYRCAQGMSYRGWALALQGQWEAGLAQIRQGILAQQTTGAGLGRPYWLAMLAEAWVHGGDTTAARHTLAEACTIMQQSGERVWEAEVSRLQGTCLLRQEEPPAAAQAERHFHHALAVARQQQAKSLELRAAMSLSRLWHQQEKRAAAYELLAPIYGWFTEGFDTADLQEAKALLEELEG